MSQENVDLARRAADAFNRRDLDAWLALVDDDVETVSRLAAIEGAYHGLDGLRRYWENLFGVYPDLTVEVLAVRELGNVTVAEERLCAHGAGSGTPLAETVWVVSEWRDGKTVWWSSQYTVEADALEAARLRE